MAKAMNLGSDIDNIAVIALMLSLSGTVFSMPWLHAEHIKDGDVAATRRGETIAGAIVVGTGLLLSSATNSKAPLLYGILITAVYCAGIEYTVQQNASN